RAREPRYHPNLPAPIQRLARRRVPTSHGRPRPPLRSGATMTLTPLGIPDRDVIALEHVAEAYIAAGATDAARKCRRLGVVGFKRIFGDLHRWNQAPVRQRRAVRSEVMSFAAHAVVVTGLAADPVFVVTSCCRWGTCVRNV